MERRYQLLGIDYRVGNSGKYLPADEMNGLAREALQSSNPQGRFKISIHSERFVGKITSIRAYDFLLEEEVVIPFSEFQENAVSERMRISARSISALVDESRMYADLCLSE